MEVGDFSPTLYYIQTPASYSINFELRNNLPGLTVLVDAEGTEITRSSQFIVIFPSIMEHNVDNILPGITSLDGNLRQESIDLDTEYVDDANDIDCRGFYACYRVSHNNEESLPGGTNLRIQIQGPENAISQQTAGPFAIQTQLVETINNVMSAYEIDFGTFETVDSDGDSFTTQKGGITPQTTN